MTIDSWLSNATARLGAAGIPSNRLDALILLEATTGLSRAYLLAHPEETIQGEHLERLSDWLDRRVTSEPIAYILGSKEFYGRKFTINRTVLVPRPESEAMIELLLAQVSSFQFSDSTILDIGTGSGCLAVTAKLELPNSKVVATDVDEKCLKVARQNAKNLGATVEFLHGSLLEPIYNIRPKTYNLFAVLANLPYVPANHPINADAKYEPRSAIFAGNDGLDLYRQLWQQIGKLTPKPKLVITESLRDQHSALTDLATANGYRTSNTSGLAQLFYLA